MLDDKFSVHNVLAEGMYFLDKCSPFRITPPPSWEEGTPH